MPREAPSGTRREESAQHDAGDPRQEEPTELRRPEAQHGLYEARRRRHVQEEGRVVETYGEGQEQKPTVEEDGSIATHEPRDSKRAPRVLRQRFGDVSQRRERQNGAHHRHERENGAPAERD